MKIKIKIMVDNNRQGAYFKCFKHFESEYKISESEMVEIDRAKFDTKNNQQGIYFKDCEILKILYKETANKLKKLKRYSNCIVNDIDDYGSSHNFSDFVINFDGFELLKGK